MFSKLNYAFDIETGDVIIKNDENNNISIKQNKNIKSKKKKKNKSNYISILSNEINDLDRGFNKNYILQSIKFARLTLLEYIKNTITEKNIVTKNNEIDGLYLSNFLMIKLLYDRKDITLDILKNEKDYLLKLKETITRYNKNCLNELLAHIISYIEYYFKDLI